MGAVSQARKSSLRVGAALQQVVFQSVAGRRGSGGDPQLAVDRAHVRIDGNQANDELLGDLRAGQARGEETQHFNFAGGQTIGIGCCWLCWWSRCWCCWERLKKRDLSLGGEGLFWRHGAALFPGGSKSLLPQLCAHGSPGE